MNVQVSVTIWTILCFLLMMLILDRLLFRPLLSFMDRRREKIDHAREEKAAAIREREEMLALRKEEHAAAEKRAKLDAAAEMESLQEENARLYAEKRAENVQRLSELDVQLAEESERILAEAETGMETIVTALSDRMNQQPRLEK